MVYMGKRALNVRERARKTKTMQLFRVPVFLPLLVFTCWAVIDGVYGDCTSLCKNTGICESDKCNCTGTGYGGHICDEAYSLEANCTNTIGSYTCKCKTGYTGNGTTCKDIDECKGSPCDGHANCANTIGSYTCKCRTGYAGNGKKCTEGVCSEGGKECLNGGACNISSTPTTCSCSGGYTGNTCQSAGGSVTVTAYLLALTILTVFVIQ